MTSATLTKARDLMRSGGPIRVAQKAAQQSIGTATARFRMIRRPTFNTFDQLLDYSFTTSLRIIRPIQVRSEIKRLLEILAELRPARLLEIGTANGGTLFLWPRIAARDALIVSLDLPGGQFGGGYPAWKNGLYRSFALPGQRIELVRADSHLPSTLERIRSLIASKPLDFLLIDGDHTYAGAKQDFEMYGPLVRSGGVIAFHDITPNQNDRSNEVRRLWDELKTRYPSEEIIEDPAKQPWGGIGVLRIP